MSLFGMEQHHDPDLFKTPEGCLAAVRHHGESLRFVPQAFMTEELCLAAVRQNPFALMLLPKALKTPEFRRAAILGWAGAVLPDPEQRDASAMVVGVGGSGTNAVNHMIASGLQGVVCCIANTDAQSLQFARADRKILLGERSAGGLSPGTNPELGRAAALESMDRIKETVSGAGLIFVVAGMGGSTGTGAAPVIAGAAREAGALTIGIVTAPFLFEGKRRRERAEQGIAELQRHVDGLITIPNECLFQLAPKEAMFTDLLRQADEAMHSMVRYITEARTP